MERELKKHLVPFFYIYYMRVKNYIEYITESLDTNSIRTNQKRLREYIKILRDNDEIISHKSDPEYKYNKYELYINYFIIIHNALLIEEKFYQMFKLSNKEINKYLDLPKLSNIKDIIEKFSELYDSHNKVRFAIETKDSIEEVRQYYKKLEEVNKRDDYYSKIFFKLPI